MKKTQPNPLFEHSRHRIAQKLQKKVKNLAKHLRREVMYELGRHGLSPYQTLPSGATVYSSEFDALKCWVEYLNRQAFQEALDALLPKD